MDTPIASLPSYADIESQPSTTNSTPKKNVRNILFVALMFIAAMGMGYAVGKFLFEPMDLGLSSVQKIVLIAGVLLALPMVIVLHELGHLLGGKLAGFQFSLLIVGPVMISRKKNGLKLSLNKNMAAYGGLAASMPTDTVNLRNRLMWFVAGGPLTSLTTGLLFLGISSWLYTVEGDPSFGVLFGRITLMFTGLASVVIAVITMIPGKTGGFLTDGARLRLLIKGGPAADREMAMWQITTASMAGNRPEEWPIDAIAQAIALQDDSPFEYVMRSLAYVHAMDRSDYASARIHMDRNLQLWHHLAAALRPALATEAAYFEAVARNDAEAARDWLDNAANSSFLDKTQRLRSEIAVLLAEGNNEEAQAKRPEFDKAVSTIMDVGMATAQRDWLNQLFTPHTELS